MKQLETKVLIKAHGKVLPVLKVLVMIIVYVMTCRENASAQITPAFSHSRWDKTITFTDHTSNPNAYYTAKAMLYGDGTSDTAFTMSNTTSHIYAHYGIYKVTLKVYSTAFNTTFDTSEYVTVDSCAAGNFTLDKAGASTIELTAHDTMDKDSIRYVFNTGDGDTTNKPHCFHHYSSDGTYTVCLWKLNLKTGCSAINCKEITVKEGVVSSLEQQTDIKQNALHLYPNPVQSQLTLSLSAAENEMASYSICDIIGHEFLVNDLNMKEGETQKIIDVNSLPAGLYVLRINLRNQVLQTKFIKVN